MGNFVYVATSMDGFISAADGGLDWLSDYPNPDGGDLGFSEFMKNIDVIVMGRNTFNTVLSFDEWPYRKPVWVMSRTLVEVPAHLAGKVRVANGDPEQVLEQAAEAGYHGIYVDGGSVIRSFLEKDLIDEMTITVVPIILGRGTPLFTDLSHRLRFSLRKSETLIGQLVKNTYTRLR